MDASSFETSLAYRNLSRAEISEMRRTCPDYGWVRVAAAFDCCSLGFEQEALPAPLPP